MAYVHTCPHCGTQLSVNELPVEKTASRCPHCQKTVILLEHGAVLKKPTVYRCLKCNNELIYDGRPPFVHCEKCNSVFITSEYGNCLISPELLSKGDKGELEYKKKRDRVTEIRNGWNLMPQGKKNGIYACIVLMICICIGTYIYSLPPAIEKSLAYADMENVWKEFREKNPYNIQIEGLKRYEDNSYVAIISEPNERVSEDDLKDFFDDYNCEFRTDTIKLGYDGWLRDAVVSFNDLDEEDIPEFSKKLSKLLYGTDYKASVMDFNTIPEHTAFSSFDLNGQVTEEELRKWFLEDKEQLVNYDKDGVTTTLSEIFNASRDKTELYYSKESGFVVWVLEAGECNKDDFKVAARKFSLDSDLILGAIHSGNSVAVIARERCVPIYELSPMRQETLCLLASTEEDELAQSYERTSLFAGKQKGGKDFAPIYLSDELWHTEYGNILNVTDQMLKSWSENGMIDYVDFDYPKPVNWTFNAGVSEDLGVSELTYNWNTEGVGYIVEDDSYDIYALNRTGSLPVSYIPGESEGISDKDPVYLAEQQAYDFFSNLSSPELVKVVQYAAMYQIFTNFGINVEKEDRESYEDGIMIVPDELKMAANARIKSLSNFGQAEKKKIADFFNTKLITEDEFQNYNKYRYGFRLGNSQLLVMQVEKNEEKDKINLIDGGLLLLSLDSISNNLSPLASDMTLMGCLGSYLIDRNGTKLEYSQPSFNTPNITFDSNGLPKGIDTTSKKERIVNALKMLQSHSFEIQRYNFIIGDITVEKSKELYLNANKEKCRTWMKCPTIVESWQLIDSINGVGGHNLNSKVTRFKVGKNLKVGETRIGEDGVIEISTRDRMTRVSDQDYLRRVGRLGDNSMGNTIAVRPKSAVIGITKQRTARGFNSTDHLTVNVDFKSGHSINGKKFTDFTELLNELGNNLVDGKAQFKQIEITGLKGADVDVEVFLDGVAARMRKGAHASIPLEKYDFNHPTVQYEGDKALVTIPIKAGNIEFASTSSVMEAGFGGSSKVKPKMNIKGGEVTFKVPKNKLNAFLDMIREYLAKQKGVWNEFKIKIEMKRRGIEPADCEEKTRLKVAKIYNKYHTINNVWTIQEETA